MRTEKRSEGPHRNHLRRKDVDLRNTLIQIRETSNCLSGVGVYADTPKMPLLVVRCVYPWLQFSCYWNIRNERAALPDAGEDRGGRVFPSDSGASFFPGSIMAGFSGFVPRTGLPKATVHSLRHPYIKPKTKTFYSSN